MQQLPTLDSVASATASTSLGPAPQRRRRRRLFGALVAFLAALLVYNLAFFNVITAGRDKFGSGRLTVAFERERNRSTGALVAVNAQISSVLSERDAARPPGRLVLMLVDALRYDFIFHDADSPRPSGRAFDVRMPFVHRLIGQKQALPFKLTARPPTVTLPRLKTLVSGIVPDFIDVLWNLNTTRLREDSWLRQAKRAGRRLTFFGDDTWLRLFSPATDYFERSEGVSSFIASDYDEVDANVTRHLAGELERRDWDLMILHYLGLDHVGHMEGPFAPVNIRRKLAEMDEIVRKIYASLGAEDTLVVLSDHGMANEGGHGGSSFMEVTTPLLFIRPPPGPNSVPEARDLLANISTYKQVDFAATLSCLVGLPVPEQNRGVAFLAELLDSRLFTPAGNDERVLSRLRIFKCLSENLLQLSHEMLPRNPELFRIATAIGQRFADSFAKNRLRNDERYYAELTELNRDMEMLLRDAFRSDSSEHKNSKEQMYYLITSIACMAICAIYLVSSFLGIHGLLMPLNVAHLVVCLVCTFACQLVTYFKLVHDDDAAEWLYARDVLSVGFLVMLVEFLALSLQLTHLVGLHALDALVGLVAYLRREANNLQRFYALGAGLYLVSLFSSSFVEEEHQIWYFLDASQLYLLFALNSGSRAIAKLKHVAAVVAVLAATRFARSINQTGNKWIHLKDFGDTLREQESKMTLVVLALVSLVAVFVLRTRRSSGSSCSSPAALAVLALDAFSLGCIFHYHASSNAEWYTLYERNQIAQLCYLFVAAGFVARLALAWARADCSAELQELIATSEDPLVVAKQPGQLEPRAAAYLSRLVRLRLALEASADAWISLACLLQPSHNLVLVALWAVKEHFLARLVRSLNLVSVVESFESRRKQRDRDEADFYKLSLLDLFLVASVAAQAGFFSQGNSNSLNTVQVSSGMVGVNELNRPLVGLLMTCATYSALVFWFFFLLRALLDVRMKHLIRQQLRSFSRAGVVVGGGHHSGDEVPRALFRVVELKTLVLVLVTLLYTLSSFIQRQHLFVWSVFAPKLIYQLAYFLFDSLLIGLLAWFVGHICA